MQHKQLFVTAPNGPVCHHTVKSTLVLKKNTVNWARSLSGVLLGPCMSYLHCVLVCAWWSRRTCLHHTRHHFAACYFITLALYFSEIPNGFFFRIPPSHAFLARYRIDACPLLRGVLIQECKNILHYILCTYIKKLNDSQHLDHVMLSIINFKGKNILIHTYLRQ